MIHILKTSHYKTCLTIVKSEKKKKKKKIKMCYM